MRILIIGGTRFIGPHVVSKLHSQGHQIAVLHRGITKASLPEGTLELLGDRNELDESADQIGRFAPEIAIDMYLTTNRQAEQLVKVTGRLAKRIVAVSSGDVYRNYGLLQGTEVGQPDPVPLTEDAPLRTELHPYRDTVADTTSPLYDYDKIPVERTVMSSKTGTGTVLRLPIVYGPNDYQHRFYAWARRMKDQRPYILMGKQQADWIITRAFCQNCGEAIALAAIDDRAEGRIYNVGEPEALSERDWLRRLAELMRWSGEIVTLPDDQLPEHLKSDANWQAHLAMDSSRLRRDLGYAESISVETALARTIKWELANPPDDLTIDTEYAAEDTAVERLS